MPGSEEKPNAERGREPSMSGLDTIFKNRFHGADSIRGIRYQILYSVLRAFDLYAKDNAAAGIRLEGMEDVDLLGMRLGDEYIQVKSSQKAWSWSRLKTPMQRFLEVYRVEPECRLVLAVNFRLRKDIAKLGNLGSLPPKERARLRKKFRKLCDRIGASAEEADALASTLTIVSVPEEQIFKELRATVADAFRLGSEAVDTYVLALVAKFLEWAANRKTVSRDDLDNVRAAVGEALARETEFQAYGRGLIDSMSWEPDANTVDFFEGKATRPGHIAAGVDVRRPIWLETIDKAIHSTKICVLRSSSGQGKSALLFRYAYERWPADGTFVLRVAESSEHVELVRNYLQFRADLGLPILLLIDNAGWRTQLWPFVAQECAALGVRVLVTIRNEDWYRFARESLTGYEILEPALDLDEARQIFRAFRAEERLHPSVDSAEWAYERIGEPQLLMEYVYLLTHGRMLEERLRDQIREFSEHKEDPAKVEILRRTALADALGVPVFADKLLQGIQLRDDPQQVLNSLSGEYVNLEGGIVTGLHWVRSDHLARILHEGYPDPSDTALGTLGAIPHESIPAFVSNAICRQDLATDVFKAGLVDMAKNAAVGTILAFIDGIFEAGGRQFLQGNRGLFDEAYDLLGPTGPVLLATKFAPIGELTTIDELADIFKDDRGENVRILQEIASRASKTPSGLHLACRFLDSIRQHITVEDLQRKLGDTGRLLDYCALCNTTLPAWRSLRDACLASTDVFDLPLDAFCNFAQALYHYDEPAYRGWFSQHREHILGYLKLNTDCIDLKVSDGVLYIEFFPDPEKGHGGHEDAISRLNVLRCAIPFCERYQSRGIWIMPFGLKPSIDETHKDIPRKNLPCQSDIEKNAVWRRTVQRYYLPDSYYRYQQAWDSARRDALLFVRTLSKGLQRILVGRTFNFHKAFEQGELPVRLAESLKRIPDAPLQTPVHLSKLLKDAPPEWSLGLQSFLFQTLEYIQDKTNRQVGKLAVYNFLQALDNLPRMHTAFAQLFEITPDYFSASELNDPEQEAYRTLADLLDAWIVDPPKAPQRSILRYVRAKRERKRREILSRVRTAVAALEEDGMTIILGRDTYVRHPLRFFPLAFSVDNPCYPERELGLVIQALAAASDVADFFCLVPIHEGARFLEGGYQISSTWITESADGRLKTWESLVPHELADSVWRCLPDLPFHASPRMHLRANVAAVLGGVRMVADLKNRTQALKKPGSRFEAELSNRYEAKLRELELGLGMAASEVKGYLETTFPSCQADDSYKTVRNFLAQVEERCTQGLSDQLLLLGTFDAEEIDDCIEQLLQQ